MKIKDIEQLKEGTLSIDVPNEDWLQDKIDYARSKGRNSFGVPYMGSTTASVRGAPPRVRVMRLASLPGMRNEQTDVRKADLKWLMDYMDKNKRLPPANDPNEEYLPFIMVAYNGEAWVNEGNHRIMAAYRLNWQDMPIEIRYFDGGERIATGPMAPGKIGLGEVPTNEDLNEADTKVTDFIEAVYAKYPQTFQNNHVMPMGGTGDDQQFAMFELVPSFSRRGAVEVKWIQAYPLRQGVGSRAMQELQGMAKDAGIALTLFPWDKGQVSQAKLTKFYKSQGFKPTIKGAKNMAWTPESLDEAFDQPYPMTWEKSEADDSMDALAQLPDGSNLSIMFNMEYDEEGEEVIQVEFHRNNSQEVTGDGDAQRVFATVLAAIQQYIKTHNPKRLTFSASKEVEPDQNSESRAKLYDRLVMRYARTWGYRPLRADTGSIVRYELSRLKPVQGVAEDSVSLNEVPMADYRPLGVKDPLYSTAVTDSKIVKGLEEQELDEGGWASAATQNTKITPAVIGEAVGILKEFETEFNQWQANQELDVEIKIGNPVGSGTYYKRDLAQDPERLYGDVDVMCYIHGREGVGAAHRTAEYAEAVEEFTQGHSNYSTDNGTNVFMVTSAGLVQVDLIYTYHEHANWARMLAPEYRVKGVINTSLVSSVAEVLNLSIGVQGIQVKTRGGQPVNFRQGKDIKLSTVSVNPENWGADIYSYYYELEHGALPKIPANLAKHGGLKDEQRISDIVLTIKAVVTSMEREKLLGTGALSHIANKRDMIQQIARIFGAKLEKVINSSKFDKGITPMAKKNANKTKLMLAKYRNEITKLLLN